MKIISLSSSMAGSACAIATSIKKYFYNNNMITSMFDYLEISLESINQILNISNNEIENYLRTNNEIYLNWDNNNSVLFKNFDKIISHHDLPNNYSQNDYDKLIEKYIRRYNRLINDIKYEDIIFFIRYGDDNIESIEYFINIIKKINPTLDFYYINVNYDENENKYINNNLYNYVNFYDYIDINKKYNEDLFYKTTEYNWKIVYDIIYNKLTNEYKNIFKYF